MKRFLRLLLFLLVLLSALPVYAQHSLKIISWNIQNLGKAKSDSVISFIAATLNDYDIVTIQEVVAGEGGAQAVAKIADALGRKGSKWDYRVSDPTSGSSGSRERYAFLWKPSVVKLKGKAWLESKYAAEIDREPYMATFSYQNKDITIVSFHAISKARQPETEIKYLKFLPALYPALSLVFCGDFNCPETHTVFNPLKQDGYPSVFINTKTTLKQQCGPGNDCMASPFDNFFYSSKAFKIIRSGIVPFYRSFDNIQRARKVSDHVPVFINCMPL